MRTIISLLFSLLFTSAAIASDLPATQNATPPAPKNFPLAVWLQDPRNVEKYKAIGINLYVGLWEGPTEAQLAALEMAHIPVICSQNPEGLKPRWKNEIVAWMQQDEPDNAQSLPDNKGYGPPIKPDQVLARYHELKTADPTRPILLNLGQGVAWDDWVGRGDRTHHPEDYPLYANAGDILSFDIYPVTHTKPEVAGKLSFVATGAQRLIQWSDHKKPVWACIETTHIDNPDKKPTPAQVKSEVWLAITHGAQGIIYFAHEFQPKFIEAGLLQDKEMADSVSRINHQIQELAPALNAPDLPQPKQATVRTPTAPAPPIAFLTRQVDGVIYVFAVNTSDTPQAVTITLPGLNTPLEVLDESRKVTPANSQWSESFTSYQVHLYKSPAGP